MSIDRNEPIVPFDEYVRVRDALAEALNWLVPPDDDSFRAIQVKTIKDDQFPASHGPLISADKLDRLMKILDCATKICDGAKL